MKSRFPIKTLVFGLLCGYGIHTLCVSCDNSYRYDVAQRRLDALTKRVMELERCVASTDAVNSNLCNWANSIDRGAAWWMTGGTPSHLDSNRYLDGMQPAYSFRSLLRVNRYAQTNNLSQSPRRRPRPKKKKSNKTITLTPSPNLPFSRSHGADAKGSITTLSTTNSVVLEKK